MKNLIFDLDGTLGDTLPICIKAFQHSIGPFLQHNLSESEISRHFGISEEGIINFLLPDKPQEGLTAFLDYYSYLLEKKPHPFPGVRQLLTVLQDKGHFITMVTGKSLQTAMITLEKFKIAHYFYDIIPGSPTGEIKTHCINELIRKHHLNKAETVYIGDAVSDIIASHNSGIQVIAAAWASTADIDALTAANPNYLFHSFADFAYFLQQQNI